MLKLGVDPRLFSSSWSFLPNPNKRIPHHVVGLFWGAPNPLVAPTSFCVCVYREPVGDSRVSSLRPWGVWMSNLLPLCRWWNKLLPFEYGSRFTPKFDPPPGLLLHIHETVHPPFFAPGDSCLRAYLHWNVQIFFFPTDGQSRSSLFYLEIVGPPRDLFSVSIFPLFTGFFPFWENFLVANVLQGSSFWLPSSPQISFNGHLVLVIIFLLFLRGWHLCV